MDRRFKNYVNYLLEGMRMDDEDAMSSPTPKKGWIDIDSEFEYPKHGDKYKKYFEAFYAYKEEIDVGFSGTSKWENELKKHNVTYDFFDVTHDDNTTYWFFKEDENLIKFLKFCEKKYNEEMNESRRADREGYATRVTRFDNDENGNDLNVVIKKYPFAKEGLSPSNDKTLSALVEEYKKGMKDISTFDSIQYKFYIMRMLNKTFEEYRETIKDKIVIKTLPIIKDEIYNEICMSLELNNEVSTKRHDENVKKLNDILENLQDEELDKFGHIFKDIKKFKQFAYTLALIRNEYKKKPQYRNDRIKPLKESNGQFFKDIDEKWNTPNSIGLARMLTSLGFFGEVGAIDKNDKEGFINYTLDISSKIAVSISHHKKTPNKYSIGISFKDEEYVHYNRDEKLVLGNNSVFIDVVKVAKNISKQLESFK